MLKNYTFNGINHINIKEIVKTFNEAGFVVIKNGINKRIISNLKDQLYNNVKKNKIKNKLRDLHLLKNGEISSAHNLSNYLSIYKKLENNKSIKYLAKNIYGQISKKTFNSSYFAKPRKNGIETKPHQDNAFFCMEPSEVLTFWFPVKFANKINGGLYYYLGSHKSKIYEHNSKGNLGASMSITKKDLIVVKKKYKKIYIDLKIGDFVVHSSNVVHGSKKNTSKFDRNAFNFSIASKKSKEVKKLKKNYKEKLKKFLNVKKQNY